MNGAITIKEKVMPSANFMGIALFSTPTFRAIRNIRTAVSVSDCANASNTRW
jgi:hypothetical protein